MAKTSASDRDSPKLERLQKVLASAGYGSRRQCEELIVEGRVTIDKKADVELGTKVDPQKQKIHVDGVLIKPPRLRYFLLNKPSGVVSTASDPWARLRVIDLVESEERLFTVGRLDKDSSGLILVTNDGQLANGLAHPRYEVTKTYQATVVGKPSVDVLQQLRKGIHLSETFAKMKTVTLKKPGPKKSILEIILTEGKNREIRRLLARVGHKVVQLKRIALGPVRLGEIPSGAYRELTREEVKTLYDTVQGKGEQRKRKRTSQVRGRAKTKQKRSNSRQKRLKGGEVAFRKKTVGSHYRSDFI